MVGESIQRGLFGTSEEDGTIASAGGRRPGDGMGRGRLENSRVLDFERFFVHMFGSRFQYIMWS